MTTRRRSKSTCLEAARGDGGDEGGAKALGVARRFGEHEHAPYARIVEVARQTLEQLVGTPLIGVKVRLRHDISAPASDSLTTNQIANYETSLILTQDRSSQRYLSAYRPNKHTLKINNKTDEEANRRRRRRQMGAGRSGGAADVAASRASSAPLARAAPFASTISRRVLIVIVVVLVFVVSLDRGK
jgi:hypothetical protein